VDEYSITAPHYDASYAAKQMADLPFYLELARQTGGAVLDVGCGTGRMALPIAQAGIAVTAVDASESMLNILRGKLDNEPGEIRSRITIRQGDMRNLELIDRFPLVIVPFRALQHLYTVEDQIAALTSLRQQLTPGGRLAFDVFFPKFDRILTGVGHEIEEMSWKIVKEGRELVVRRFFIKDKVDPIRQVFSGRFIYRTFDQARFVEEEFDPLTMSWYTHGQLQLLFRVTGLEPVAEYGGFDKRPLRVDSPEMIFILRKK
jgi:SAM-dependent methyltransferase